MKKQLVTFVAIALSTICSYAQREVINFNDNWKFSLSTEVQREKGVNVNLPHTYNLDALAGNKNYFRGAASYIKMFDVSKDWIQNKQVYLKCKGINHTATLFVNAKYVETHKGGYTAFAVDITPFITEGKNSIWIRTTNALDLEVAPLVGDFNFYGGIYRDVELIVTPKTNIAPNYWGSNGVFISTPEVNRQKATVEIKAMISSTKQTAANVQFTIYDALDNVIGTNTSKYKLSPYNTKEVSSTFTVTSPILWQATQNPYLYKTIVKITAENDDPKNIQTQTDSISQHFALRYFEVNNDNQFLLNGIPTQVKGVCKHQDYAGLGNAIRKINHNEDMKWIKEIGANAVRLAHYPFDPYFLELCDKEGIMVWSEIPLVGPGGYRDKGFVASPQFKENCATQLKEMIRQLYNHPSIIWWGLFNELTQRGDDPVNLIKELNAIAKEEDPQRLTVAASNQDGSLNFITDLVGFNQYMGWYGGEPGDIAAWGERLRKEWPHLKVGISEYGAGASIYQHQDDITNPPVPNSYFHPEGYQSYYHEKYWRTINDKKYFWGTFIWNLFDFGAAHRTEGDTPGINDKGLVTFDRKIAKDAFYFYKANWNKETPFIYIVGSKRTSRSVKPMTVKIFSSCQEIKLIVNGFAKGTVENDGYGTFVWEDIPVIKGKNTVVALGINELDASQEYTFTAN